MSRAAADGSGAGHAWEIAWNPARPIDADGNVTFAA